MTVFTKFDDVQDPTIRTWNRVSVFFNIMQDFGPDKACNYLRQFNPEDKLLLKAMFQTLKAKGLEYVKAAVSRGEYVAVS